MTSTSLACLLYSHISILNSKMNLNWKILEIPPFVLVYKFNILQETFSTSKFVYLEDTQAIPHGCAHPLNSPMVVQSLYLKKGNFWSCNERKKCLGAKTPYLGPICALIYLVNCTRPNIAFAINLLAKFSAKPTKRHWKVSNISRDNSRAQSILD